ncbi:MAG: ATP-binding cassette domain-containing protein, partial [Nanoarchaeota archaeon]
YPSRGRVLLDGAPIGPQHVRVGLMLGNTMLYHRMTGYDNLQYFARLYSVDSSQRRIQELCTTLDIGSWIHDYVERYSNGMKSKLALARALIHDPDVLLLDEPTSGLDPDIAASLRSFIRGLNKTIIVTTHNLYEVAQMTDRILLLQSGRLRADVKIASLKQDVEPWYFTQISGEKL